MTLDYTVKAARAAFLDDRSTFALLLDYTNCQLTPLRRVPFVKPDSSFQANLNALEVCLDPHTALYVLLRRNDLLVAVTFVPYLAPESHRQFHLDNRHELVRQFGEGYFSQLVICKEIAEVTYARAWEERDELIENKCLNSAAIEESGRSISLAAGSQDVGYKKSKYRACDRRMKTKIAIEAQNALSTMSAPGSLVQMAVDINTETLVLITAATDVLPEDVAALLPTARPSFTLYRHMERSRIYFIFHSPDNASVNERMNHTIAIPGLVNVHAEDAGVHVDQKIEIHDPDDLIFEKEDVRTGKFRSMYLRNDYKGTESAYEGLKRDAEFFEQVK